MSFAFASRTRSPALPAKRFGGTAEHGVLLLGARGRENTGSRLGPLGQARDEGRQVVTHSP